jgi:hypothetical protein
MREKESAWTIFIHLLSSIFFTIGLIYAPESNVNIYYVGFLAGAITIYGFEELYNKIKKQVEVKKPPTNNHY